MKARDAPRVREHHACWALTLFRALASRLPGARLLLSLLATNRLHRTRCADSHEGDQPPSCNPTSCTGRRAARSPITWHDRPCHFQRAQQQHSLPPSAALPPPPPPLRHLTTARPPPCRSPSPSWLRARLRCRASAASASSAEALVWESVGRLAPTATPPGAQPAAIAAPPTLQAAWPSASPLIRAPS